MKQFITIVTSLLILTGCSKDANMKTVRVAATSVPHAEILEQIKPDLKAEGIDLEIIIVEDYNTPNRALADKEVDANFFQHHPFLEMQMNEFGYPLEVLTGVHLEPMGLYSKKVKQLQDLPKGSSIAIPSDPTNQARALHLLEQQNLVHFKGTAKKTSVVDLTNSTDPYKIVEIDSPLLARSLDDVELAAITTNFALQADLSPQKDALAREDQHSDFVNLIVIRKGEADRMDLQALKKAATSEKVKRFINERYRGSIYPAF
jgi:D-methionine transport system substrate-binding protein